MTPDRDGVDDRYDLDQAAMLPDFTSLPAVAAVSTADDELVSTYFDTTDLALAAAGGTLRRRAGGEDAGWHLELDSGGARLEIGLPPGRAFRNPPVALRRVVAGIVQDRGLAPVLTIRTGRRVHRLHDPAGDVVAEVVDDRVSAEPTSAAPAPGLTPISWREAGVEVVAGDATLLAKVSTLLASVGVRRHDSPSKLFQALGDRLPRAEPPALPNPRKKGPAADVIQLRLLKQVAVLRRLDPWVRHDAPEAVHDMRVTVRRLRHALASYRPFLDREQSEPLRDELGWFAGVLGGPRDCEVLHQVLRTLVDDEPDTLVRGPVRARIDLELHERSVAAREALLSTMTSSRYPDLVDRLEAFAHDPPWTDAAGRRARRVLPERLDHDWKRLRARAVSGGDVETTGDGAEHLHHVRKAAKRVRYAAEALLPLYGEDAERMVRANEGIQTVLGDHHDEAEAMTAILELSDRAATAGENGFTYGVLHARLAQRCADHEAQFEKAWERSVSTRERHRVG